LLGGDANAIYIPSFIAPNIKECVTLLLSPTYAIFKSLDRDKAFRDTYIAYESKKVYHRQKREGNLLLVKIVKHNLTECPVMVNYKMQRGCHYIVVSFHELVR